MSYTLYDAALTTSKDALTSLEHIIKKAQASPVADAIPAASIHPDMRPFTFQVHMVTNNIQKMVSRLAGEEATEFDRNLETYEDMLARVAETHKRLDAAPGKATIDARGEEKVTFGLGPGKEATVLAWQYVHGYSIPNLFFHVVTAYDIARKEGVDLGKLDFISPFMGKFLGM